MRPHILPSLGFILAAVLLTGGCAPAAVRGQTDVNIVADDAGNTARLEETSVARTDTVAAAPAAALEAAASAYATLGMAPNNRDPVRRIVGVRGLVLSRNLQGVPLREYFDCGVDNLGVPLVNYNRVELNLLTEVQPAATGSLLFTTLTAKVLRTGSGAHLDPLPCRSRSALETKLAREIVARAGGT